MLEQPGMDLFLVVKWQHRKEKSMLAQKLMMIDASIVFENPQNWDPASITTIAPTSSGTISILDGGSGNKLWSVSGSGFWLDPGFTLKSLVTTSNSITLYSSGACGSATITVGEAVGYVRSTTGQWSAPTQVCLASTLYLLTGNCCNVVEGKFRYISCIAIYEDSEPCVTCAPYACTGSPSYCGSEMTVDGWKRRSWGDNRTEEWVC